MDQQLIFELAERFSPILVNGKRPIIPEWSKYCDKLPEEREIEYWLEKYPAFTGVGICMGKSSRLICLDIDDYNNDVVNRIVSSIPHTPLVRKGKKGLALFFRRSDTWTPPFDTMKTFKRAGDVCFEIFIDRKQVVIPPSIHPDTREPYVWMDKDILDIDVDDIPEFDEAMYNTLVSIGAEYDSNADDPLGAFTTCPVGFPQERFAFLKSKLSKLIAVGTPFDDMAEILLCWDEDRHDGNMMFVKKSGKGLPLAGHNREERFFNAQFFVWHVYEFINKNNAKRRMPLELSFKSNMMVNSGFAKMVINEVDKDTKPVKKEYMPESLYNYIKNYADCNETAFEYVMMSVFSAFSTAICDKVTIKPDPKKRWKYHPQMSVAIVGDPSVRKSTACDAGVNLLQEANNSYRETYQMDTGMSLQKAKDIEIEVNTVEKQKRKLIADGEPTDSSEIQEMNRRILELQTQFNDTRFPIENKNYMVNDATIQALQDLMSRYPGAYMQYTDELAGFLALFNQRGQEQARQVCLQLMNGGVHNANIERKNKELSRFIKEGYLNVLGTIQPSEYAKHKAVKNDGLFQRIHPVFPDYELPDIASDAEFDEDLHEQMVNMLYGIMDIKESIDLRFSLQARADYLTEDSRIRKMIKSVNDDEKQYLGKLGALGLTYCAIFHMVNKLTSKDYPDTIQPETVAQAFKLIWVNYDHYQKCIGLQVDPELEMAHVKKLYEYIKNNPYEFTIGSLSKVNSMRRMTNAQKAQAIAILQARGFIKCSHKLTKGSSYMVYKVNPGIKDFDDEDL